MKRLILIAVLLVFAASVSAADFMDSFAEYQTQIRLNLGVTATNTSYAADTTLNRVIRLSAIHINNLLKTYKTINEFVTVYHDGSYDLDSVIGVIYVEWSKNDSVKALVYAPKGQWYQLEVQEIASQKDYKKRPSYYDFVDGTLYLFPAPVIAGDTIRVTGWEKIGNISAAASLTDIKQRYRTAVLAYATYRMALSRTHPSTQLFKGDYEEAVISLKGAVDDKN